MVPYGSTYLLHAAGSVLWVMKPAYCFPLYLMVKKNNSTIPNTHSLFFLAAELEWKSTFDFCLLS